MKKYRRASVFSRNMREMIASQKFKPILLTVATSLCIGMILGFIVLQMVTEEPQQEAENVQAKTLTNQDAKEEQVELPEITTFVHQGGVFAKQENAAEYAKQLEQRNIAHIIREEAEQYYVWMNLANSEEQANELINQMDKQGMDVYVKAWEIPDAIVEIGSDEGNWLRSFHDLLVSSLTSNAIDEQKWRAVIDSNPDEQAELQQIILGENQTKEQQLLDIVAYYEKSLKELK